MLSALNFLIGLATIPHLLMAQNITRMGCYNSGARGLDVRHCLRALKNVVYDTNGRLDNLSKIVFVWHKTCVINIQKPEILQPDRRLIELTVQSITKRCQAAGGFQTYQGGLDARVYRSTDSNVYEINQPMCSKRGCNYYQVDDCIIALNRLPVDTKGTFMTTRKARFSPQSEATWGNCTVTLSTTDSSAFRLSHLEVKPAFDSLLHQCGSRVGKIYFSGGTAGNNGDVVVSTRGPAC